MSHRSAESRAGLAYGVAAYGLWGIVPLYFAALRHVAPAEFLGQRICWSTLLLAGILTLLRGWGRCRRCLANGRTALTLVATAALIGVNWYLYIYAANQQLLTEASLGYFIAPLVNTALGVVVLGERLRWPQVVAIALAAAGVVALTVMHGEFPWLALGLAFSFSVYGLFRKTVAADALTGLTIESILLTPLALGYLIWIQMKGEASFGHVDRGTDALLMLASVVTVTPLFCFAQAARRLRLTTIGFLQFLSPTVQLVIAVAVLHEPFDRGRLAGFIPIWLALLIYVIDAIPRKSTRPQAVVADPPPAMPAGSAK
jgi:chloramphenicol-sensitive protein RarD